VLTSVYRMIRQGKKEAKMRSSLGHGVLTS